MQKKEKPTEEISKYEFSEIPLIPRRERNRWNICIPNPFRNCERIYPIQQRKVAELLEEFKTDPDVQRVVVFGSSVTDHCHIGSDVDIYVEVAAEKKLVHKYHNFLFDLWTNFTVDGKMLEEIKKKGVVVYAREL